MDEGRPSPKVLALSLVALAFFLGWQALALRSYLRVESRPPSWEPAATLQAAADFHASRAAKDGWRSLTGRSAAADEMAVPPFYNRSEEHTSELQSQR